MSLVVVCFLAVSGDHSHDVLLFPIDPVTSGSNDQMVIFTHK
jgi:hypothetical protein